MRNFFFKLKSLSTAQKKLDPALKTLATNPIATFSLMKKLIVFQKKKKKLIVLIITNIWIQS